MNNEEIKKELDEGILLKSAEVMTQDVTEADLRKINKFTLSPLKAEEVFTFKTIIGDNELDDRNYEPFNLTALQDLKRLYIGKTVIKDHFRRADNQVARIYDTELETEPKFTKAGEPFTKLIAKCYMVKTDSNADLITEIKAGIKKEVSSGCRPKKLVCNICGVDNMKHYCAHYPGVEYETETGKQTCLLTIDGVKEAYELSLVAVPAQVRAGTTKRYGVPTPEPEDETKTQKMVEKTTDETVQKDSEIDLEIRSVESFIFVEKNKEEI